jgi:hypothetical protein
VFAEHELDGLPLLVGEEMAVTPRISSVVCPSQASINRWSMPFAAQFDANERRKTCQPRS